MAKKSTFELPMVRRMLLSLGLWAFFALLCAYFAASGSTDPNFWGSAVMWSIFFNRLVIWFVVALVWFIVVHPILKIRMYPICRWACVWFLVSLSLAFSFWDTKAFWLTVLLGIIYGAIIDLVASKIWGEGRELLEGTEK